MKQTFVVASAEGLHFRPASLIVSICKQTACSVRLIHGEHVANPLSLISILKLGARYDELVTVTAEGNQAREVVSAIGHIIESIVD
jgi:phosphocarrier protein HPr